MKLERFERILIKRGHKDDRRQLFRFDVEHAKAIQLRHLNIEEYEIGRMLANESQRLATAGSFRTISLFDIVFE